MKVSRAARASSYPNLTSAGVPVSLELRLAQSALAAAHVKPDGELREAFRDRDAFLDRRGEGSRAGARWVKQILAHAVVEEEIRGRFP